MTDSLHVRSLSRLEYRALIIRLARQTLSGDIARGMPFVAQETTLFHLQYTHHMAVVSKRLPPSEKICPGGWRHTLSQAWAELSPRSRGPVVVVSHGSGQRCRY